MVINFIYYYDYITAVFHNTKGAKVAP